MINVTKMKKMVNDDRVIWGVEGDYMLVSEGHRIYKDHIENFEPKIKGALFEKFGRVPEEGETLFYNKSNKQVKPFERKLSDFIGKQEDFTVNVERLGLTTDDFEIMKTENGLVAFDKEYSQVFKDPKKLILKTSEKKLWFTRFTFEDETMEYYLLPLRVENLEDNLREKLGFNVEK